MKKVARLIVLALVLVAGAGVDGSVIWAATPEADAGPDQTVPGPSPVSVQFDGSGSTGDITSYKWYNQWGALRAEGVAPTFEVNFGNNNPKPGTTRTFTLVVEDDVGNTDSDKVTITLGEQS